MVGSLTEIPLRYKSSAADCHRLGDCMCFAAGIARDCTALEAWAWATAGTGAGILLADCAREPCMAGCLALEVTAHIHSIATVSVVDPGRTWGCRRQHQSWTCGSERADRCWRWCKSCYGIARRRYSVDSTAGHWSSPTWCLCLGQERSRSRSHSRIDSAGQDEECWPQTSDSARMAISPRLDAPAPARS